jgi:hypothetical protein
VWSAHDLRIVKKAETRTAAVLDFLAHWQMARGSQLPALLTAGQLADIQELEHIYSLPDGSSRFDPVSPSSAKSNFRP